MRSAVPVAAEPPPGPLPTTTRSGRAVRATWKVCDQLPEALGIVLDGDNESSPSHTEGTSGSQSQHVRLLLTERIKTSATRFGLSRLYKRRPVQEPDSTIDLHTVFTPREAQ